MEAWTNTLKMKQVNGGVERPSSDCVLSSVYAPNARKRSSVGTHSNFVQLRADLQAKKESFAHAHGVGLCLLPAKYLKLQSAVLFVAHTISATLNGAASVRRTAIGEAVRIKGTQPVTYCNMFRVAGWFYSTASSWNGSLDGNLGKAKTFIISTASATTTARRTLSYGSRSNLQVRAFTNNSTVLLAGASSSERYLHAGMR